MNPTTTTTELKTTAPVSETKKTADSEARQHHAFSPSTLQYREACPCYKSRQVEHIRSIAGTMGHGVVETGQDNDKLGDDDAVAAAECIEFREERLALMEEDRARFVAANPKLDVLPVLSLKEIYLPIDDCKFDDCESTTAGFVDCALVNHTRTYAELLDWKFGVWPVEDAEKNLQGISYCLGLFRRFPTLEKIQFFFKQPHIDSLTHATFTRAQIPELYLRVQTVVHRARKATGLAEKGDFSMAKPYVPVCNFCDRIADCPIHLDNALKVAKKFDPLEFPADIDTHRVLDPKQASLAMKLSAVVKIWAEGFRSRTTDRVLRGDAEIPEGYTIATGGTRRKIINLGQFEKVALRYVKEVDLKRAAEYSFGPIEDLISEINPRGTKASMVKQFQQDLLDSGAVVPGEPYSYLRVKSATE